MLARVTGSKVGISDNKILIRKNMKKDTMLQGEQFVISYELLYLLHWLLKYEETELSKLINKSFIKGVQEKAETSDALTDLQLTEDMQNSIVDFFNFMEQEISDLSDQESTKAMNKDVMQTLDHLDPKILDLNTIKTTISKRASKKTKRDQSNKNQFFKELLKQWKPKKEKNRKNIMN